MITITLMIDPIPGNKTKFTRRGIAYTPTKYRDYKNVLQALIRTQWKYAPLNQPLGVTIDFIIPYPKTKTLNKFPTSPRSGDLDNLAKPILDAMNKLVIHDDRLIVNLRLSKDHGTVGQVVIKIFDVAH